MAIERLPCAQMRPGWANPQGDRFQSHPTLRFAIIQLMDDEDHVYVVTDQALPAGIGDARDMIIAWRVARAAAEE